MSASGFPGKRPHEGDDKQASKKGKFSNEDSGNASSDEPQSQKAPENAAGYINSSTSLPPPYIDLTHEPEDPPREDASGDGRALAVTGESQFQIQPEILSPEAQDGAYDVCFGLV